MVGKWNSVWTRIFNSNKNIGIMEINNGKKYEEAIKIHSEVVKTMDSVQYGLLKDGDTFYRYGTEPKESITFSMRQAYEIHRFITTQQTAHEEERTRCVNIVSSYNPEHYSNNPELVKILTEINLAILKPLSNKDVT